MLVRAAVLRLAVPVPKRSETQKSEKQKCEKQQEQRLGVARAEAVV